MPDKPHTESSEQRSRQPVREETQTLSPAQQMVVALGQLARRSAVGKHTEDLRDK